MTSPVTLLLMVILLADARAHLAVDESLKTDFLGDLKDKTDQFKYEKEPEDIQVSWHAVEEMLELVEELGNVTSTYLVFSHCINVLCPTLSLYCLTWCL